MMSKEQMVQEVAHMIAAEQLTEGQMRQIQGAIAKYKNAQQRRSYFEPKTDIPYVHIRTEGEDDGVLL